MIMKLSTHNSSRRRARRLHTGLALASALLLTPLVASTTAASAESLDAAGTQIVAFGDTRPIPSPPELVLQATTLKQRYCAGRGEPPRAVSMNAAL
jgi:hypothetical protein